MTQPHFVDGVDRKTFAPFELIDARDTEWADVRLSFSDWTWLQETHGTDTVDEHYLNGYGVEALVLAARVAAGLAPFPTGMDPNSEGDTCYLHFTVLATAIETATLAQQMIGDLVKIRELVVIAKENDFED